MEYPDQGSDAPRAVVSLRGSEICVDPSQRPVTASMEQLFVDPDTGQVSDVPQRFAYGLTTEDSVGVEVRGPGGQAQSLRVMDAPGAIKVFAGSVTGYPAGTGSVTATDAQGRVPGSRDFDSQGRSACRTLT